MPLPPDGPVDTHPAMFSERGTGSGSRETGPTRANAGWRSPRFARPGSMAHTAAPPPARGRLCNTCAEIQAERVRLRAAFETTAPLGSRQAEEELAGLEARLDRTFGGDSLCAACNAAVRETLASQARWFASRVLGGIASRSAVLMDSTVLAIHPRRALRLVAVFRLTAAITALLLLAAVSVNPPLCDDIANGRGDPRGATILGTGTGGGDSAAADAAADAASTGVDRVVGLLTAVLTAAGNAVDAALVRLTSTHVNGSVSPGLLGDLGCAVSGFSPGVRLALFVATLLLHGVAAGLIWRVVGTMLLLGIILGPHGGGGGGGGGDGDGGPIPASGVGAELEVLRRLLVRSEVAGVALSIGSLLSGAWVAAFGPDTLVVHGPPTPVERAWMLAGVCCGRLRSAAGIGPRTHAPAPRSGEQAIGADETGGLRSVFRQDHSPRSLTEADQQGRHGRAATPSPAAKVGDGGGEPAGLFYSAGSPVWREFDGRNRAADELPDSGGSPWSRPDRSGSPSERLRYRPRPSGTYSEPEYFSSDDDDDYDDRNNYDDDYTGGTSEGPVSSLASRRQAGGRRRAAGQRLVWLDSLCFRLAVVGLATAPWTNPPEELRAAGMAVQILCAAAVVGCLAAHAMAVCCCGAALLSNASLVVGTAFVVVACQTHAGVAVGMVLREAGLSHLGDRVPASVLLLGEVVRQNTIALLAFVVLVAVLWRRS